MAERPGNDPAHPREQITRTNTSIAKNHCSTLNRNDKKKKTARANSKHCLRPADNDLFDSRRIATAPESHGT